MVVHASEYDQIEYVHTKSMDLTSSDWHVCAPGHLYSYDFLMKCTKKKLNCCILTANLIADSLN